MKVSIVIGLGFGDEGKGLMTNILSRQNSKSIVVRFSGGQQAGHTVIMDGKKHIFSNYGAGSLNDVPSYFTDHTSFYLNTMELERRKLAELSVYPSLIIHPLAKMTTPYDVAYNRLLEKVNLHGSVGLGIAATHKRDLDGYKLYAQDYFYKGILKAKLSNIKDYYVGKVEKEGFPRKAFLDICEPQEKFFLSILDEEKLFDLDDYSRIESYDHVIFEGSQGVMLDMDHGIFPNVTWGNTTSKNVFEVIDVDEKNRDLITTYYMTRCYQTRHGNGWMSNKEEVKLINTEEEINQLNEWQGSFKKSELDYSLLNYAIDIDHLYNESGSYNIVVTCLDQRPDFIFDKSKINSKIDRVYDCSSPLGFNL